ncbi:MAG: oxidoreductase [Terracidiphilus sp.]
MDSQTNFLVQDWPANKIPPQAGRLAVVTGAANGLGYEIALALAKECLDVIIADENEQEGREAVRKIRLLAPHALVRFEWLDVANLNSVSAFACRLAREGRALDLLINAATLIALPERRVSAHGFEMQFAANYLGHFALTGLMLPLLCRSSQPRTVQVSSLVYRFGVIRFDDLQGKRKYKPWAAYFQSKLAMILFALELQRRSDAHGWGLLSCAVHPGFLQTELVANILDESKFLSRLWRVLGTGVYHSAAQGALPALFAANSEDAVPGGFYGPGKFFEFTGPPAQAFVSPRARNQELASRLWSVSEQLAGISWSTESI